MGTPVTRLQPEGVLRCQSVPPLIPAYNKFMGEGEVDRTDQLRKMYGLIGNQSINGFVFFFNSLTMLLTIPICCINMAALLITLIPRICLGLG